MSNVTFLDSLNNLDLQAVARKLGNSGVSMWTVQEIELAIARYKMFLHLKFLFPDMELVPTQEIDEVWHAHILTNTYQYMVDCQNLYGYILHHRSDVSITDEAQQQSPEMAFATTQALFEEIFGTGVLKNHNYESAACMTLPLERAACVTLPS
jgi:hypothetical protein